MATLKVRKPGPRGLRIPGGPTKKQKARSKRRGRVKKTLKKRRAASKRGR